MPETITITDDRTGKTVTVPIEGGVFPSSALRELDPTLYCYDPAYLSTASTRSAITYLDGANGVLRYGGYPIEQLAEKSTYLEVAYLLLNGELPNTQQLADWTHEVTHHTFIHENMRKRFVDGFHYDAHPMGMFVSAIAALGTFYNGAKRSTMPISARFRSGASSRRARPSQPCVTSSRSGCRSTSRRTTCRTRRTS